MPQALDLHCRGISHMRRARPVASFALNPGAHASFGIGGMTIEAPGYDVRWLLLPERQLHIGRRCRTVAHRQPRAIARRIPGNTMFEIGAVDRPDRRDPANPCSERPLEHSRSALSSTLHDYLNPIGRGRV